MKQKKIFIGALIFTLLILVSCSVQPTIKVITQAPTQSISSSSIQETVPPSVSPDFSVTPKPDERKIPLPLLYEKGGSVYLACGTDIVNLGKLILIESDGYYGNDLNGMYSADNKILYYLANVDTSTCTGNLMCIDMTKALETKLVAEGVYSAVSSDDGQKVLFLKNVKDGFGDLYELIEGNEAVKIADSVADNQGVNLPEDSKYGFSHNGKNIYYIKKTDPASNAVYTLYKQSDGGNTEEVTKIDDEQDMTSLEIWAGNNGQILYSMLNTGLCFYSDGDTEKLAFSSVSYFVQGVSKDGDGILYCLGDELYYKTKGKGSVDEAGEFSSLQFDPQDDLSWRYYNIGHFVTAEKAIHGGVYLYENTADGQGAFIAKADDYSYKINNDFSSVSFTKGGKLYTVTKSGDKWSKAAAVGKDASWYEFAPEGDYLYYLRNRNSGNDIDEDGLYGDLYMYSISGRKSNLLMKNVTGIKIIGGIPYATTISGALYKITDAGKNEKITDNVTDFWGNENGIYIIKEIASIYDIYFMSAGSSEPEAICPGAEQINEAGSTIKFILVVPEEVSGSLMSMDADAGYFLDNINGTGNSRLTEPRKSATEDASLAKDLINKNDLPNIVEDILNDFNLGFNYYAEGDYSESADYLNKAITSYESIQIQVES